MIKKIFFSKIGKAFSANVFGQVVTIAIQIVSLPLFLKWWSVDKYGEWLIISAIPIYFSLSDIGFVAAAKNKMAMLAAGNKNRESLVTFQSSFALMMGLTLMVLVISGSTLFGISFYSSRILENGFALWLLIMSSVLSLSCSLIEAVFRANGEYAKATYIINWARLLEWGAGMLGLMLWGTIFSVACSMAVSRFLICLVFYLYCKKKFPFYEWSFNNSNKKEIGYLLKPSIAFMMFPIGNALSIQGLTLITAAFLGPSAVALLNTYRTISRVIVQAVGVISHSFWPEFSRYFGMSRKNDLKKIYKICSIISLAMSLVAVISLLLLGRLLIETWTHGEIPYERNIFILFLISAVLGSLWHTPRIILLATNNHGKLSMIFLCVSGFCVLICAAMISFYPLGAVPIAIIVMEILMIICSYKLAQRVFL